MLLAQLSFPISYPSFHDFLVANVPNADGICTADTGYLVIEKNPFVQADIDAVNTYYNGLTQSGEATKMAPTTLQIVNNAITQAGAFGVNLTVQYASSNVLQGITQAGKTQLIADYLKDVAYYLHNGSLYAAIDAFNSMLAMDSDTKASVAPYVTDALIYTYMNKVQTYLQIPLTVNPES